MTGPLRPVFVTGRGAVTALGRGVPALLGGLAAGRTGVLPRRRTAAWAAPTAVAGEFPAELLEALGGGGDLAFRSALMAANEALAEAGEPDRRRLGLVLASTKGDLSGVLDAGTGLGLPARLAHRTAAALGLGGVIGTVSCACASGLVALVMAARRLATEDLDRVLVVGVDVLHEFVMAGFGSLHALDPGPCRPFDRARRGLSVGEAAGALVLSAHDTESVGAALVGHGGANDACHVTGPDRQGQGLALAAARALASAGLTTAAIDLLHLHGTATAANDASEALGLAGLWGGRTPPAFGTKGQTGHTLGAGGVIETIASIGALQGRRAFANHGLVDSDVDPGLDLVRTTRELPRARHALKVASGFGGVQAAVVIRV